jgi:hypothetical protein
LLNDPIPDGDHDSWAWITGSGETGTAKFYNDMVKFLNSNSQWNPKCNSIGGQLRATNCKSNSATAAGNTQSSPVDTGTIQGGTVAVCTATQKPDIDKCTCPANTPNTDPATGLCVAMNQDLPSLASFLFPSLSADASSLLANFEDVVLYRYSKAYPGYPDDHKGMVVFGEAERATSNTMALVPSSMLPLALALDQYDFVQNTQTTNDQESQDTFAQLFAQAQAAGDWLVDVAVTSQPATVPQGNYEVCLWGYTSVPGIDPPIMCDGQNFVIYNPELPIDSQLYVGITIDDVVQAGKTYEGSVSELVVDLPAGGTTSFPMDNTILNSGNGKQYFTTNRINNPSSYIRPGEVYFSSHLVINYSEGPAQQATIQFSGKIDELDIIKQTSLLIPATYAASDLEGLEVIPLNLDTNEEFRTTTSASGYFTLYVTPGTYRITIHDPHGNFKDVVEEPFEAQHGFRYKAMVQVARMSDSREGSIEIVPDSSRYSSGTWGIDEEGRIYMQAGPDANEYTVHEVNLSGASYRSLSFEYDYEVPTGYTGQPATLEIIAVTGEQATKIAEYKLTTADSTWKQSGDIDLTPYTNSLQAIRFAVSLDADASSPAEPYHNGIQLRTITFKSGSISTALGYVFGGTDYGLISMWDPDYTQTYASTDPYALGGNAIAEEFAWSHPYRGWTNPDGDINQGEIDQRDEVTLNVTRGEPTRYNVITVTPNTATQATFFDLDFFKALEDRGLNPASTINDLSFDYASNVDLGTNIDIYALVKDDSGNVDPNSSKHLWSGSPRPVWYEDYFDLREFQGKHLVLRFVVSYTGGDTGEAYIANLTYTYEDSSTPVSAGLVTLFGIGAPIIIIGVATLILAGILVAIYTKRKKPGEA